MKLISSPIFSIRRHRIEIDGPGIRTLVGFYGCPLKCKYCINPQCKDIDKSTLWTPKRLFEFIKVDDLYFRATNGGVTFGGGEPGLNYDFIKEFRDFCNPKWNIAIETTLNYSKEILDTLIDCVDYFIIDIKDLSKDVYKAYTSKDNVLVIENLKYIAKLQLQKNCIIKIPQIPNYNFEYQIEASISKMKQMGFYNIETFDYKIK